MWRVKYVQGNATGSGSSGDWKYYEAKDRDRMERDIFEALLNGSAGDGVSASRSHPLSRVFRRRRAPDLADNGAQWRRYEVREVAYLDGVDWVPVEVAWEPPRLVLGASHSPQDARPEA